MNPQNMMDISKSKNIDQYTRFFEPTIPTGQLKEFNRLKTLIGKETRVANIIRSDMNGYIFGGYCAQTFLEKGQRGLARFVMISDLQELTHTDSFGGETRNQILTQKFEYTQKQDITEHMPEPQKKGLFNRRK